MIKPAAQVVTGQCVQARKRVREGRTNRAAMKRRRRRDCDNGEYQCSSSRSFASQGMLRGIGIFDERHRRERGKQRQHQGNIHD